MRRLILAALAACALTTSASALDLTIRFGPPQLFFPGATASITHVPAPRNDVETRERDAAISRWEEHCKPVRWRNADGIVHLSYAHPGCEFGEGE